MTDPDRTAETVPRRAEPGPARPGFLDRMARRWAWIAVLTHIVLHDRRFQAAVITSAIGAYALGSATKENKARPLRRATAWYRRQGRIHEPEVVRRAERALKPGKGQTRR